MSRHFVVGVQLDSDFVTELLDPRSATSRIEFGRQAEESGIDFLVFGGARLDEVQTASSAVDATVAATVLARHTTRVGLVVAAAPFREHPYNLARRIASLDHGSHGRAGWLVGARDYAAPAAGAAGPWTAADPIDAAVDAVAVARELWESWPGDSIVGDSARGVFAESDRITHIDHSGAFSVSGPLNVPEPPQEKPAVFWRPSNAAELAASRRVADVIIFPDEHAVQSYRESLDPDAGRDQVLLVDRIPGQVAPNSGPAAADGVVFRGVTAHTWPAVYQAIPRGSIDRGTGVTLRDRLGVHKPDSVLDGQRSAFPVS